MDKWHDKTATATVQQLIDKLKEFPPELGVGFLWEGQFTEVDVESFASTAGR